MTAEFLRTGVDPISRCTECGAAVAVEGQDVHREWHQRIEEEP